MNKFQVNQCTNEQLEMIDPLENFVASKNLKYRYSLIEFQIEMNINFCTVVEFPFW